LRVPSCLSRLPGRLEVDRVVEFVGSLLRRLDRASCGDTGAVSADCCRRSYRNQRLFRSGYERRFTRGNHPLAHPDQPSSGCYYSNRLHNT